MTITCSACYGTFKSNRAFDVHAPKCPAGTPPLKGESWDDYKARADKVAAEWRLKNKKD